ncbi:hypothetical protein DFH06DRAFT_1347556 [Mycena polygramma]|nr:hypothetical protein DFH06DRAFT_1347556 [Mycena polygramma]
MSALSTQLDRDSDQKPTVMWVNHPKRRHSLAIQVESIENKLADAKQENALLTKRLADCRRVDEGLIQRLRDEVSVERDARRAAQAALKVAKDALQAERGLQFAERKKDLEEHAARLRHAVEEEIRRARASLEAAMHRGEGELQPGANEIPAPTRTATDDPVVDTRPTKRARVEFWKPADLPHHPLKFLSSRKRESPGHLASTSRDSSGFRLGDSRPRRSLRSNNVVDERLRVDV